MKILTAAEMRETDRRTAEEFGVGLDELMERAGGAVAGFCLRRYPTALQIGVLCGKGNNGGDGFVAARILAQAERSVRVVLLGKTDDVRGEAATALHRLQKETPAVNLHEVLNERELDGIAELLEGQELLIDAVVGTGFKPPVRGVAAVLRDKVAKLRMPVVAVDVPSGWDSDSTEQESEGAFRADAVVTFTAPKMAHVLGNMTGKALGPIVVAGIGSPEAAVVSETRWRWTGSAKEIAEQPRTVNANKGNFGHVLVIGGSYGKAGAPSMSSLAAMRMGAGLVTAAVPKSVVNTVAGVAPELMLMPMEESEGGTISLKNLEDTKLEATLKKISVVAVGPGLSTEEEAPEFVRQFVQKMKVPMVIDADALNAFEGQDKLLTGKGRVMVLTPHPGEMARLAGMTVKQVEADRVGLAVSFATKHKVTLVLKGWRTVVAHPDGSIGLNTSGNPSMAKGGSGDILTGMVAAMLAQYPENVAKAVEAAVYLHGLAADLAMLATDEHTVLATDTVTNLPNAFRYRVRDDAGLTWICGLNSEIRS